MTHHQDQVAFLRSIVGDWSAADRIGQNALVPREARRSGRQYIEFTYNPKRAALEALDLATALERRAGPVPAGSADTLNRLAYAREALERAGETKMATVLDAISTVAHRYFRGAGWANEELLIQQLRDLA